MRFIAATVASAVLWSCGSDSPRYEVETYRPILRSDPDEAERHFNCGVVLTILDRKEEAARAFEEAVRLAPEDAEALFRLGLVYSQINRTADAAAVFRKSFAAGTVEALHSEFGMAYYLAGKIDEAAEEYEKALRADEPHPVMSMCNLGSIYLHANAPEKAVPLFEQAIAMNASSAAEYDVYANLAVSYQMTKQFEKAAGMYEKALALKPGNADILYNKALLLIELKDPEGVLEILSSMQQRDAEKALRILNYFQSAFPEYSLKTVR
jgi:tetratricopeptide (TPR) repeat protein